MKYDKMTLDELNAELDRRDADRLAGKEFDRPETRKIMAARNAKILEEQADIWGLSVEDYQAATAEAETANGRERDAHAAQIRVEKLVAKEQTPEVKKELEAAKKDAKSEADAHGTAAKEHRSKAFYLNEARRKAMKEARKAQTANAGSVGNRAKAKSAN